MKQLLRAIPSVNELVAETEIQQYLNFYNREMIVDIVREEQDKLRNAIINHDQDLTKFMVDYQDETKGIKEYLINKIYQMIQSRTEAKFKRVINCTGTVLHTNLGRAPLSSGIMEKLTETVSNYSNLEYDLDQGSRGSRYDHIEDLITTLTGAESAMVVNNNAAAVMLVLKALAQDKEVILSRGELVEIGGSFRIPEVMKQSGAHLVEVGTTNKTHLKDYEQAISEETGLIMKVHTSNYEIIGFTDSVSRSELVEMSHNNGITVVEDLGSGLFLDLTEYGLDNEPTIKEVLDTGVDLVTFSGDKLLGGPQTGIIAGRRELIQLLKQDQLTRALRVDKLSLKALEETLRLYLQPEQAREKIPVLNMLTISQDEIKTRAKLLYDKLSEFITKEYKLEIESNISRVGGGAMPTQELPTWVVTLTCSSTDLHKIWDQLRQQNPPIVTRLQKDKLVFDLRTVSIKEIDIVASKVTKVIIKGE
ncbi:L-seryl-tRNA(Sec) selenium transferase [Natranaerobius thermophilus JW/NM-WN-LF]|uniref:L-seryl-tRNA(Sec) selenium transferase n=1 Tax=Natranaerobius thermophilus (strain ATCC BAA-1301 / DSM 18059 / JW/NM-WN-LF) TaxID=457570 RepID=B2A1K5_NATTJ|nr:L-seryl-tRNA(Sec) selenium transferase [Natranaerobius thermophilus]ACB84745.1 L-seryl-tRNA(Sec) selenium transferase [Natranaerobius thermophilus JW/NM-WN-LF]